VSVDDNERIRIVGTGNFELSEVGFELDIALREEELGVIFVEDTVRDADAIDVTVDLDICIVGLGEVSRAAVVGDGQFALEEGSGDIVSLELELVAEATLDSGGEDGVEGEEEEVVIAGSGVGGLSISGRRGSFHSAEAGGHSLEAMVWEELELEEHEEPEEDSVWRDVGLVDEREGLVSDEHLG
jgi:hypothetical protein